MLHISPTFLIKLLDKGAIPYIIEDTNLRFRLSDVLAYKQHHDLERDKGMEQLVQISEELGLNDR